MTLELDRAGLRRGTRRLLTDTSLKLEPGTRIALCGPNGAGKSSLLALLAGDLRPAGGRIRIDGRPPGGWTPAELARRRAMLVQQTELGHPFRMEQVVGLGPGRAAPDDAQAGAEARAALIEELGIAPLRGRVYTELSGGEQRLVQCARVLNQLDGGERAPGWLLLDEPVSHLDLGMGQRVLDAASRRAAAGCGVLAVLHDLELASRWAERVLVLADGALQADGAPETVLTSALVSRAWAIDARVRPDPDGGIRVRMTEHG